MSHTPPPTRATEEIGSAIRWSSANKETNRETGENSWQAIDVYLRETGRQPGQFLFAGRGGPDNGLTVRQCARLTNEWLESIGLDPLKFGTHSPRRTKATLIDRKTATCALCSCCSATPRLRARAG